MRLPRLGPTVPAHPAAVDVSLATRWGEAHFAKIFQSAPAAMALTVYANGLILDVNTECERLLGYARKDLIGRTIADLNLFPDPRERVAGRKQLTEYGYARDWRLHFRTASGAIRTVRGEGQLIDLDGECILLSSFADETDHERRMRESEERFSAAFKAGSDAYFIVQRDDGRIVDVNDRFVEMFGYSKEECRNKTSLELGTWADPAQRGKMLAVLAESGRLLDFEAVGKRKNGDVFPLLYSAVSLQLSDRVPIIIGALRDITAWRALEDKVRQTQKLEAVAVLAGGVAHDFNNILTVILSSSDFLLNDKKLDPKQRRFVEMIQSAGVRASRITRQLQAFSRQRVLAPRPLDLNAAIRDMRSMLERLIGEDIQLQLELDETLCPIMADPSQIQQILLNMAVNARDAMTAGGILSIITRHVIVDTDQETMTAGRYAVLMIRDTGTGMSEEVMQRIFDPFFTTKETGKGTGLGLAIVQSIVADGGGTIAVESKLGAGTTFTMHFPGREGKAESVKRLDDSDLVQGSGTILLVEDDDLVRANAEHVLSSCGYRVLKASKSLEALEMAADFDEPLSLLLTDVVMPTMGGHELAGHIASMHPETGVLYMSGHADDTLLRRGVQQGPMQLLPKPFTPAELSQAVHHALTG